MNIVFIITDTQCTSMVGAYGNPKADTPNLDRLAAEGIRFDCAYTASPVCTPARGAIFSGLHPQVNGAWGNNMAPHRDVALMGDVFQRLGYRAGYTGKWHLDAAGYFGDGQPDGGFEPGWWYDGKNYADDLGPERFECYRKASTVEDLRKGGFTDDWIWGHRVADRAVDFLEKVGDDPFLLVASFDEPHGPYVCPEEYWESTTAADVPKPEAFMAPLDGKPALQKQHRQEAGDMEWETYVERRRRFIGCNRYIDRQIGRVLDAVRELHGDDTVVVYTSDHGDQMGAHGLHSKGAMMYDESARVPFIVKMPGGPAGAVCPNVVSLIDLMPTFLDLAGKAIPEALQGVSLKPCLADPSARVRDYALVNFNRFAINHDGFGELYPIRCAVNERWKLALNLFEEDELYDRQSPEKETRNRIGEAGSAAQRDAMHDWILEEMGRIRDPFRSFRWGDRSWRTVRERFYSGGERRNKPEGFPWQHRGIEAH